MSRFPKTLVTFFKYFLGLLIFGILVFVVLFSTETLSGLSPISWANIISLGLLTLLYLILTAATFKAAVFLAGTRIHLYESFSLMIISNFLNYLAPARPGLIAKAVYLRTARNVSIATYSAISWTNALLMIMVSGVLGIIALSVSSIYKYEYAVALYFISTTCCLIATLFLFVNLPEIQCSGRLSRFVNSVTVAVRATRINRLRVARLALLLAIQYIAGSTVIYIAYHSLGIQLSMFNAIVIATFSTLSAMVSITPNNLGIQELIIGLVSATFGIDFAHGLVAGGLLRLAHLGVIVLVTPFALLLASRTISGKKTTFF
jgi:uncharacterized membrane protein YbhN (UPF0104 family)